MKKIFFFYLVIIIISFCKSEIEEKKPKHGQDCTPEIGCDKNLSCILYRCTTDFEKENMELLGLSEQKVCDNINKCPSYQKCFEHRCIDKNDQNMNIINNESNINDYDNDIKAHLLFTGSILLVKRAFKSGEKGNDRYNYNHLFTYITKQIKSADLSVTNMETVFYIKEDVSDKNFPLRIYNTPKEIADGLAYAGFRVILHGSAFSYSLKDKGITNTLNFWEANYPFIKILGISRNEEEAENNYYIYKIGKIKVGIINYSAFKSNNIPEKHKYMVNTISNEKVGRIMDKLKNETDFNIICINWGEKNGITPNKKQIKIAKKLADFGVDLIIGNHPYYVQPVSYVQSNQGNKVLVFWSLGLFLGDVDRKKNITLGAMVDIKLRKKKGKTFIGKYNMIPVVNHISDTQEYSIYKLEDYNKKIGKRIISIESCKSIFGPFSRC